MRTIHKYALPTVQAKFSLDLPTHYRILCIGTQPPRGLGAARPVSVLWAEVDPEALVESTQFYWVPTGGDVPKNACYIGTVQLPTSMDELVLHLYRARPEEPLTPTDD